MTGPSPGAGALQVLVAREEHIPLAAAIAAAIAEEVDRGAIGMARREPAFLAGRMRAGEAVLALEGGEWRGFCYVHAHDGGRFVATSALIVRPGARGQGVARALKERALALAAVLHPRATPFGLTTSPAVVAVNRSLGFREAAYSELPRDPAFWKGCEACPHHGILEARGGASCLCTAMRR